MFMRALTLFIRSYVFRAAREQASFQSIMSTTKEEDIIVLMEFGEPKRAHSSGQFSCTSSGGRGSHRGSSSFHQSGRGRGRAHFGRGDRTSGRGTLAMQGGGRGSTQTTELVECIEKCKQELRVTLVMWKTPPCNRYKFNTDGSVLQNPGKIGGEGILRDDQGVIVYAFAVPLGEGTNNQAEVQAACYGLNWLSVSTSDLKAYLRECLFHLKNVQVERKIQVLEDMLQAYVIDFGASWDRHLTSVEFAYNNNYHSSMQMAPPFYGVV
ncbi:hypothetical protein MTR67_044034 [Solanum verrucosum]|uniref:RNase H type-1 domain-containing protein n=1 Tax=Solanum verrucosum TaxID=315347 RepID=A0AAF0URH1_SOLVR|nr:hypothetical protein MTR67_044034 [Solanum verrucosum]